VTCVTGAVSSESNEMVKVIREDVSVGGSQHVTTRGYNYKVKFSYLVRLKSYMCMSCNLYTEKDI